MGRERVRVGVGGERAGGLGQKASARYSCFNSIGKLFHAQLTNIKHCKNRAKGGMVFVVVVVF